MRFTPTTAAFILASTTSLTTASPLVARSTSTSFKLIYRPSPGVTLPIPVKELAHGTWAVTRSSSSNHLILYPDSPETVLTFYQYDTSVTLSIATGNTGLIITPGGTSTVPSNNLLELVPNNATPGVFVGTGTIREGDVPALAYDNGKFQACRVSDEDGDREIVLRYVSAGQRLLEGCMETVLAVRCMAQSEGEGDLGVREEVECNMTPF